MDPKAQSPPPGWYADPGQIGQGRYWDGYRWTVHTTAQMAPPTTSAVPLANELAGRARWLVRATVAYAVLTVAIAVASLMVDNLSELGALVGFSLILPPLGVAAVVLFIVWFHGAYSNVAGLGPVTTRHSPGWAIGVWFVPFLNLIRPYGMMWECWTAGDPAAHAEVRTRAYRRSQGRLVPVWWGSFLAALFSQGELRINQASWALPGEVQLGLFLVFIASSVMLIRTVTRRQLERAGYRELTETEKRAVERAAGIG